MVPPHLSQDLLRTHQDPGSIRQILQEHGFLGGEPFAIPTAYFTGSEVNFSIFEPENAHPHLAVRLPETAVIDNRSPNEFKKRLRKTDLFSGIQLVNKFTNSPEPSNPLLPGHRRDTSAL